MSLIEMLGISFGLAMDAFAAAICKGLSIKKLNFRKIIKIALFLGFFQAFMPVIGYFFGKIFEETVKSFDHWIAFIFLVFIGVNTIKDSFSENKEENEKIDFKTMIILAIATSIDALAVGITFAFLRVNIWVVVLIIGIVTMGMAVLGVKLGNKFGCKYKNRAEIFGGIILILIGTKILIEHLIF